MKVVYVSDIDIGMPNNANSIHVANMARLFHKAGFEVAAICESPKNGILLENTEYVNYIYIKPIPGKGKIRGLNWNLNALLGYFSARETKKILNEIDPDYVIIHEANSMFYAQSVARLSKKLGYKVIVETTEWMEVGKERTPLYNCIIRQKDYSRRKLDRKCGNIIAISEFLEDYYKAQGCNVVRIPPLFPDMNANRHIERFHDKTDKAKIKLVFAGTLSSKDFLEPVLRTLLRINKESIQIAFEVIGPDEKEIKNRIDVDDLKKYGIYCHGRISHDEVLEIVRKSDFSVLFRKNQRYAKAGVSTKFCEAMSEGVPSICTRVGGTDRFVMDGINGILIENNEETTIEMALRKLLELDDNKIIEMKNSAYRTALENFSIDRYVVPLQNFIKNCY